MVVKLYEADGVKVFNVTADKVIPSWVSKKRGKKLSQDADYARHIDLLQDFGFPSACHRIKITQDREHIFTTGVHAPRVRVYDLHNLSMKFERHFNAEVVEFQILTEDYEKCVFLCADRSVNFHGKGGHHFSTRVPKFGRDLTYLPEQTEVIVGGSAPELWRVNLSEGRFMTPVAVDASAVNVLGVCPVHGMLAAGCDEGGLQCFDMRQKASLGTHNAAAAMGVPGENLTALRFDNTGMYMAVGTQGGQVGVFDLRRAQPLVVKDHMYDSEIVDIKFHVPTGDHTGRQQIVSADRHIVKVWDKDTGDAFTSIEPPGGGINDLCLWPHSGLIMLATDSNKIPVFFAPSLGPAPRWCSFLEAVVDDLEATGGSGVTGAAAVYDDYRFVSRAELQKLELEHLIGTPVLRAYMHGFFVDARLYRKAQARQQPFAYEEYRAKRVAEKLEEQRQSRIATAAVAAEEPDQTKRKSKRGTDANTAKALLDDSRFSAFFEDEDFEVDVRSATYRELNPNAGNRKTTEQEHLILEHFKEAEASDDEDEGKVRARKHTTGSALRGPHGPAAMQGTQNQVAMYEARDIASADLFAARATVREQREMPLEQRDKDAAPQAAVPAHASIRAAEEAAFAAMDAGDEPDREERGRSGRGRGRGRGRSEGRSGRGRSMGRGGGLRKSGDQGRGGGRRGGRGGGGRGTSGRGRSRGR